MVDDIWGIFFENVYDVIDESVAKELFITKIYPRIREKYKVRIGKIKEIINTMTSIDISMDELILHYAEISK